MDRPPLPPFDDITAAQKARAATGLPATNVPAILATSTTLQSRPSRAKLVRVRSAMTGSTAVTVLSVKSCCRDSTTITKPTG